VRLGGRYPQRIGFCSRVAIAGLLSIVGCAPPSDRFELEVATQSEAIPLGRALIQTAPGGPPVVAVTETSYTNALVQNVILSTRAATPGQNEFVIRAFRADPADENEPATLADRALSSYAVGRELEDRFPGVAMRVSQAYTQNKYGPFGFATGSPGNGDRCFYGWQRIERTGRPLLSPVGGAVSIRLRLCERGRTEAELLRAFYGFTFLGYSRAFGWDPFGTPPGPPPELGATGVPIYPVAPDAAEERVASRPAQRVRAAPRVRALPEPAEAIEAEPLPGYPTVPAPPGTAPSTDE
jgi:hypothetical protein